MGVLKRIEVCIKKEGESMKEKLEQMLHMVERKRVTDVHLTLMHHKLHV